MSLIFTSHTLQDFRQTPPATPGLPPGSVHIKEGNSFLRYETLIASSPRGSRASGPVNDSQGKVPCRRTPALRRGGSKGQKNFSRWPQMKSRLWKKNCGQAIAGNAQGLVQARHILHICPGIRTFLHFFCLCLLSPGRGFGCPLFSRPFR